MKTNKQRLKQLEQLEQVKINENLEVHNLRDTEDEGMLSFDGVIMPKAEAERLAAALPENALLIRMVYVSRAEAENDN